MTARVRLLGDVVAVLNESGCAWALAQGDEGLEAAASGQGDLDVVSALPAIEVVARVTERWRRDDALVVCLNSYDIGGSQTFWCVEPDGGALEVDVLCDPRGLGRLGLPTEHLLTDLVHGRAPAISPGWQIAYQVSKRVWKQQWRRLAELQPSGAGHLPQLEQVFGAAAGRRAADLIAVGASPAEWAAVAPALQRGRRAQRWARAHAGPLEPAVLHAQRVLDRLTRPVGFWAHIWGPDADVVAGAVSASLGAALVHRLVVPEPRPQDWPSLASVVLRPGLAVTWSCSPPRPMTRPAMLVVGPEGHAQAQQRVAAAMADRVARRVRTWENAT